MNAAYERALVLHAQSRYADAEKELRRSLGTQPNDPSAHAMLALCLTNLKEYQEATGEAQIAVGLAPAMPFAHYALAFVLYRRNRLDEALAAIGEAIRLEPDNASYFALLGGIRFDQRNWPSALEAAEAGLAQEPEHARCVNLRAMALVKLGRRDEAGAVIDSALRRDPENADSHANLGWTLLHSGEPRKAMEHFREALRLEPNHAWARSGIVEALKARFFLYRWLLAYFLYMNRLSRQAQWAILIGGYLGYQYLNSLAKQNPAIGRYLKPVLIAYAVFAVLTWLSYPMFNLLLRLSRFGRLALTRKQTIESNIIGLLLGAAIAAGIVAWRTSGGRDFGWVLLALVLGVLVIPASGIFRASRGWPQVTAIAVAAVLAVVGLFAAAMGFAVDRVQSEVAARQMLDIMDGALSVFGWGVLISQFGLNWLGQVRPKR
jgi:tetratricopeptide (TPR) repeat protein